MRKYLLIALAAILLCGCSGGEKPGDRISSATIFIEKNVADVMEGSVDFPALDRAVYRGDCEKGWEYAMRSTATVKNAVGQEVVHRYFAVAQYWHETKGFTLTELDFSK